MLLQLFDMGRAAVDVDVQAVRVVGDHIGVGAEGVKNALGHHPGAAVGAVQADALALVGAGREGNQVAEIAVPAGGIVDGLADVGALGIGKLLIAVEIGLDAVQQALFHLVAVGIDELDSVVVIGVVAGGDHNAAVEIVRPSDIGHARRTGDMQQIGIGTGSGKTGTQRGLEHVARAAGVLADHDLGFVILSVVPAEIAADLKGVIDGQVLVGLSAKSVSSEILPHFVSFFLRFDFLPKFAYSFSPASVSANTVTSKGSCCISAIPPKAGWLFSEFLSRFRVGKYCHIERELQKRRRNDAVIPGI